MADWEQERKQWNKQGLCAREACKAPFRWVEGGDVRFNGGRHRVTGLVYCSRCSGLLNQHQPELKNPVTEIQQVDLDKAISALRLLLIEPHQRCTCVRRDGVALTACPDCAARTLVADFDTNKVGRQTA